MRGRIGWKRVSVWAGMLAMVCAPALSRGDVVALRDGSTLKGRVVSFVGDTLTVKTTFGADIRIARSKIAMLTFGDSAAVAIGAGTGTPAVTPRGVGTGATGRIGVTFMDREVASKISASARGDRDAYIRANAIEQTLIVDDVVVYTRRDTTMDKVIYNGPERAYRNEIKLEDFDVEVPAGFHHARLVIRNVGIDEFGDFFDPEPLDLLLNLDNIDVPAANTVRVKVGITRGRLRMSKPRLFRAE